MSRFAELADGRRLEFPDDTPDEVIQATVKRVLGVAAPQRTREQRLARIEALEAEATAREAGEGRETAIGAVSKAVGRGIVGAPEALTQLATGGVASAAGRRPIFFAMAGIEFREFGKNSNSVQVFPA